MILLTGAAGFIGSVLLRELNLIGREDIIVVDRLDDPSTCLNFKKAKFAKFIHADDLFDNEKSEELEKVSLIFHVGACSSTTERNIEFLQRNNVQYSTDLFTMALEKEIPIIYASSAATYGDGALGYSDDDELSEKLEPLNPYGSSKLLVDQWVLSLDKRPKHWFGLKYFNVYGPNEYHKGEMRSLIHKAFGQINEVGEVKLFKSHREDFKDGEQLRDFIYVKDVVQAMLRMMRPDAAAHSGIYNIGTGKARSFKDLVSSTFDALGITKQIKYIDMPEHIRDQYQYYTQAEMGKFHQNFPDFEFSSLEEGVKDYVKNYLDTEDPFY
jgi:ADP-L-glycero-D-manno-heptose 6-epimerase